MTFQEYVDQMEAETDAEDARVAEIQWELDRQAAHEERLAIKRIKKFYAENPDQIESYDSGRYI